MKFEVGQHMWLNVWDLKMFDRLTPHFIVMYAKLFENLHKPHFDLYSLKLQINFVAHPTFQVSKFKLFLFDEQRPNLKQSVQLEVSAIEHRLVVKIRNILCIRHTHFRGKEYLMKYKGCHHKDTMWMKLAHLDHLLEMVNKFEQEKGHELARMQKTWKKKTTYKRPKC